MNALRTLLLLCLTIASANADPLDAICRVHVPDGSGASLGSGALVEWEGQRFVITNWHVVNQRTADDRVTVTWPSEGQPRQALVLMTEHAHDADLAVLAVAGDLSNLEALPVAEDDAVESAYVGGFGGDGRLRVVHASLGTMGPWYLLGQPVRSGDSGGPVITPTGCYIGAVWGSGADLPNESVAVRIGPVRRVLHDVATRLYNFTLPRQYIQCPRGVPCNPGPSTGSQWAAPQPTFQQPTKRPLTPVQRDPKPDCCEEIEAKLAELDGRFSKLESKVDKVAELVGEGLDKTTTRFVAIETRIASMDCGPQLASLTKRLDDLTARLEESENADPWPVYYTLVADQGADYWPRLRDELVAASEKFQGIRLVAPPTNGVGQLPRLVAFRAGTPIGNVGGDRAVSEALRRLSQGQSPAFF